MAHALSLLRLGRLEEGWAAYRRRERIGFLFPGGSAGLPGVRWTGQDLRGKTILLRDEQGYGDAIQFFRYLPELRRRGAARIVLATFPLLLGLFRASTALAEVVVQPDPGFRPDFHCLTGDLPGGCGTTLETIPAEVPYLRPPMVEAGPAGGIGLVWSGDPRHLKDHARSIPAALFLRLVRAAPGRCVSLQHGVRAGDLPALVGSGIPRLGEDLPDLAAAAERISRLELVITVDTAIAHLAGAPAASA